MDGGVDINSYNGQYKALEGSYAMQPTYTNTNTYGQVPVKYDGDPYQSMEANATQPYQYGGNGYYQTSLQQALNQEFGTNHLSTVQAADPAYGMPILGNMEYDADSDSLQKGDMRNVTNGNNICDICNKQFSSIPSLKRHRETHSGQKRFACDLCGNCYTQKHNLTKHMRLHTGEKPYKCNICDKAFYIHHHLKNHMVQHTGEYPFPCPACGRGFKHKNKMEMHLLTHDKNSAGEVMMAQSPPSVGINSEENSMSEIWDNGSETMMDESEENAEDMLEDWSDEEIRNEEHACKICQQIFINPESLNNHVNLTHPVIKQEFKCEECGDIFLSQAQLVRHRKVHVVGKAEFVCEECNQSFRFKVSLHIHMRRHNNDFKKYECNLCDKYFMSKDSLKKHLTEHFGGTTYQCDECGEEFDQKSEFTSHILTHSDEQEPLSPKVKPCCKTCHKLFSSNSSLRKHEYIHMDVKPHKCTICGVSFAQKIQLRLHNKRHNGGVMEPPPLPPTPPPPKATSLSPKATSPSPKAMPPSPKATPPSPKARSPSPKVEPPSPKVTPPSPKKGLGLIAASKKLAKEKSVKSSKEEATPGRRNAPRKARNALREQKEKENGDTKKAKVTERRNAPRKARKVVKEEEEEEEEQESEEDSSDDSDSSSSESSSSESSSSDEDSDEEEKEAEKHKEPEQNVESQKTENGDLVTAKLSLSKGYEYPVCEKCNQTFRKKTSLMRHQKRCR